VFIVDVVAASFVFVVGVVAASFVFTVDVGVASLVFVVSDIPDLALLFDCCLEWLLGAAPFFCCRVGVMCSSRSP
jgi:hypothetical protein